MFASASLSLFRLLMALFFTVLFMDWYGLGWCYFEGFNTLGTTEWTFRKTENSGNGLQKKKALGRENGKGKEKERVFQLTQTFNQYNSTWLLKIFNLLENPRALDGMNEVKM